MTSDLTFVDARVDDGDGALLAQAMRDEIAVMYDGLELDGPSMPAAGQTGHHRTDWNIGDLRDVAIVQLIDFPENNHLSKLSRQLRQGALNVFGIRFEKCNLLRCLYPRSLWTFMLKFLLLRDT